MADKVANWAKGRYLEWADLAKASVSGEAIVLVLFKAAGLPGDATLIDCKFLSDVVAAGAVEADFTYAGSRRKVLTGTDIDVSVDLANDRGLLDLPDQTWFSAGGAVNNSLGKIMTFFRRVSTDPDTALRCISFHDFTGSTTGLNLEAPISLIASAT